MPRQLRVFLCHASQDKPAVRELYKRLKVEDWIDPWLDEEKLSLGQHWTTTIEDALSDADVVIIFLSRNSVQKEGFVQRELNYAWELSLEKPRNVIFLIPFRLDDCLIPRYLGSRQWGDYFGEKKDSTYQILLRSLKQRHQQKLQLEAAEKSVQEQAEREDSEKAALERAERERKEREDLERISRQRQERITAEKVAREKEEEEKRIVEEAEVLFSNMRAIDRSYRIKTALRWAGIAGIIILLLIFGGLGLNSLFNKPPETTSSPAPQIVPETSKPPTETSVSIKSTLTKTPNPSPTPTLGIGSTMVLEKDGMVMVYVPEGEFTMGTGSDAHQVNLDAFWIDRTEVTNAMFATFLSENGNQLEGGVRWLDASDTDVQILSDGNQWVVKDGYSDHPVTEVTWFGAKAYCFWMDRKLPTEAEWEKAARGTDGRAYPWGEEISCDLANYSGCAGDTTPVGSYPDGVSIYGALDMAGNVWEWVSSLYQPYPYDPNYGREDLSASGSRALRGGAWDDLVNFVRSDNRSASVTWDSYGSVGFRCSLSP